MLRGYYHAFYLNWQQASFAPSRFPSGVIDATAADIDHWLIQMPDGRQNYVTLVRFIGNKWFD